MTLAPGGIVEQGDKAQLARRMAEGRVVLFTGAGFSLGAGSQAGVPVPSVNALRELLWSVAFPGQVLDSASSLADVYEVARDRAGNAVKDILTRHLSVDHKSLSGEYRLWFSMPWYRHYTLNVDDLDEQAARAFVLPRRIRALSALKDSFTAAGSELLSVHLNGRARDYPDVTFSARDFGQRAARPDEWYQALTADLLSHPVVFVGSTLDEPTLWQHIELRRGRDRAGRELRPASYLVTPELSAARAAMLRSYNVTWIRATGQTFANDVLSELQSEADMGQASISRAFAPPTATEVLIDASVLRTAAPPADGSAYLLGRQPTAWDITDGYARARDFDGMLERTWGAGTSARLLLLTGTAGSGKSTSLYRFALHEDAAGRRVHFLNPDATYGPSQARTALQRTATELLVVDDLYSIGRGLADVIADWLAADSSRQVLAATRGTNIVALDPVGSLGKVPRNEQPIPHLADSDIELLLDALTAANRLGVLAGKSRMQQVRAFRDRAGRQLIVAMIEATSGLRFEEKLAAECDELESSQRFLYAVASIATARGFGLLQDEILIAHGAADNSVMNDLRTLTQRGLLVQGGERQFRVRHRLVAERVVEHFRQARQVSEPVRGLLFAAATKADRRLPRSARQWKLLVSLINHDSLQRLLGDLGDVRGCYAEVEDLLNWDYHFWLQRGSLEVETGGLEEAFNFLSQARSLAPDDFKVQTEWAYFELKSAASNAARVDSVDRAEAALVELEDVIRKRGAKDSYPYHVYGSQGLRWARRAPLNVNQRARLLDRLRQTVGDGLKLHPRQTDLRQLHEDLQKAYLSLAVGA